MSSEHQPQSVRTDAFTQQKLPLWQPVMTPIKVIVLFAFIGVAFIPSGVKMIHDSNMLFENKIKYDGIGKNSPCAITRPNQNKVCNIDFEIGQEVTDTIYVYYELTEFYQNHRKYVNSRDASQLQGQSVSSSALDTSCPGTYLNGSLVKNPCGLIAGSFFTDVISLQSPAGYPSVTLDETSISWPSDRQTKFKQVAGFQSTQVASTSVSCSSAGLPAGCKSWVDDNGDAYLFYYPNDDTTLYLYEMYPDQISPLKGVTDEHFIVWMRTAALPRFRKLYGRINPPPGGFPKGTTLTFQVVANFDVSGYGGQKMLAITTLGPLGGKNVYLGASYVVVGAISLMFCALFTFKQLTSPRSIGNKDLIHWGN